MWNSAVTDAKRRPGQPTQKTYIPSFNSLAPARLTSLGLPLVVYPTRFRGSAF